MKKKLIMLLMLAGMFSTHAFAQDSLKTKKESFSWNKTYMDEAGIGSDVQAKISVLSEESKAKIKQIRKDEALTEDAKKEKMKASRKELNDAAMALLTKEQKEKIKGIKERLKNDGGQN